MFFLAPSTRSTTLDLLGDEDLIVLVGDLLAAVWNIANAMALLHFTNGQSTLMVGTTYEKWFTVLSFTSWQGSAGDSAATDGDPMAGSVTEDFKLVLRMFIAAPGDVADAVGGNDLERSKKLFPNSSIKCSRLLTFPGIKAPSCLARPMNWGSPSRPPN